MGYDVIQHLRGTISEWAANDIVVPEGELALEKQLDSSWRAKIGNGVSRFSQLPYAWSATGANWESKADIVGAGYDGHIAVYDEDGNLDTSDKILSDLSLANHTHDYVPINDPITSDTKPKVHYDQNGLVIEGHDLEVSDIPDLSGMYSPADHDHDDEYVAKTGALAPATKPKITYNSDGIVTAGADLEASDIPDLSAWYATANHSHPNPIDGKSLEFNWDGTSLGVRVEGENNYEYQDLQGPSVDVYMPLTVYDTNLKCEDVYDYADSRLSSADSANTVADDDTVPFTDVSAESVTKKITLANIKAFFKTYFDTLYPGITHAERHATGSADAIAPSSIGAPSTSHQHWFRYSIGDLDSMQHVASADGGFVKTIVVTSPYTPMSAEEDANVYMAFYLDSLGAYSVSDVVAPLDYVRADLYPVNSEDKFTLDETDYERYLPFYYKGTLTSLKRSGRNAKGPWYSCTLTYTATRYNVTPGEFSVCSLLDEVSGEPGEYPSNGLQGQYFYKIASAETATQDNLDALEVLIGGKQPIGNYATLVDGKVPSSELPSYVDYVLEYDDLVSFPAVGEFGKIYVAIDTNKTYRWGGSSYAEISASLALGETSATAYRGDKGKVAYDHSQTAHAPSDSQKNVQSDWDAVSGDALILHKPTIFNPADHHATHYTAGTDPIELAGIGALGLTGGTMTGALTLSGAPTDNLHAATKKYVDDAIAAIVDGNGVSY